MRVRLHFAACLLFLLHAATLFSQTTTPNLGLTLPDRHAQDWDVPLNGDLSRIDSFAGSVIDGSVVTTNNVAGPDIGARICAADATLGANPGVVVVNTAGTLSTPCTLAANHAVRITANLTWSSTLTLSNNDSVSCAAGVTLTTTLGTYSTQGPTSNSVIYGGSADGLTVRDCRVVSSTTGVPTLLGSNAPTHVMMVGNEVHGAILFVNANGGRNFQFSGNSVYDEHVQAAILLFYAYQVSAVGNHFERVFHGLQYWGGDAGAGTNLTQVNAGDITFATNTCFNVDGSCAWGSMGQNITYTGNVANGCGDICYDVEGSRDVVIATNVAWNCGADCAAFFFYGDNEAIEHNRFYGSSNGNQLVRISGPSGDPRSYGQISVSDNGLDCGAVACIWLRAESAGGLKASGNQVHNGWMLPVGFQMKQSIDFNRFTFDVAIPDGEGPINILYGLYGSVMSVQGNVVDSSVGQPANSFCIKAQAYDYNMVDTYTIRNNQCAGFSPFPNDLETAANNPNSGVSVIWDVDDNVFLAGNVTHSAGALGNDIYLFGASNRTFSGFMPSNLTQQISGPSATTTATNGATVSTTLTWPQAFGTAYVPFCTIASLSGAPQISGSPVTTATTITVVIAATSGTAAKAQITCRGARA